MTEKASANNFATAGGLRFATAAATTIAGAGTFVKAAGTTVAVGNARRTTITTSNKITFDDVAPRICAVSFDGVISHARGAAADVSVALAVNGTVVANAEVRLAVATAVEAGISMKALLELNLNDYVELFVTNEDTTDAVTVVDGSLCVSG